MMMHPAEVEVRAISLCIAGCVFKLGVLRWKWWRHTQMIMHRSTDTGKWILKPGAGNLSSYKCLSSHTHTHTYCDVCDPPYKHGNPDLELLQIQILQTISNQWPYLVFHTSSHCFWMKITSYQNVNSERIVAFSDLFGCSFEVCFCVPISFTTL